MMIELESYAGLLTAGSEVEILLFVYATLLDDLRSMSLWSLSCILDGR